MTYDHFERLLLAGKLQPLALFPTNKERIYLTRTRIRKNVIRYSPDTILNLALEWGEWYWSITYYPKGNFHVDYYEFVYKDNKCKIPDDAFSPEVLKAFHGIKDAACVMGVAGFVGLLNADTNIDFGVCLKILEA